MSKLIWQSFCFENQLLDKCNFRKTTFYSFLIYINFTTFRFLFNTDFII
ncbi:hypothetical protein SAMN05428975_2180 [Mucilaginibacter sp. OK268]|nr:hypothetical protein SAMN05428975_2180 [Mucilaginibacter sp. OK268]